MFTKETFNSHLLLRYGFTKDFMDWYSPLVHHGVPLTMNMLRAYHVYIREE